MASPEPRLIHFTSSRRTTRAGFKRERVATGSEASYLSLPAMALYDTIGKGYGKTRAPDPRISGKLMAMLDLPPGATVLDVGAGTGKYARVLAEHGYSVWALEPSEVMQAQSIPHERVRFLQASAEAIPLPDGAVEGTMVVLALHHFRDRRAAFQEILRVTGGGPVVMFTFDPLAFGKFWLAEYFPGIGRRFGASAAALANVAAEFQELTERRVTTIPFPLPRDLQDRFGATAWGQPEAYLDAKVRNGISDFALMEAAEVANGLDRLQADLKSGQWDERHGALRTQETHEVGYRFIVVER